MRTLFRHRHISVKKGLTLLSLLFIVTTGVMVRRDIISAGPVVTRDALTHASVTLSGQRIAEASLAVADFDGDGDKEIIAGGQDGMLYVIAYDGANWSVVWERQTALDLNAAGPPNTSATTEIRAAPAVADLDGDGHLEIVLTLGGDISRHKNGGMLVYRYHSSWSFSVVGRWPQPRLDIVGAGPGASDPDGYWDGIWGSPALADLDGDGDLEVLAEGFDRRLHAWHHDGTVVDGWPITRSNGDALLRGGWSSPAVGDIDNDGLPEVIFGTDSPPWEGEGSVPDYTRATVWAVNGDSSNVPGFPVSTEQTIQSSPALGDIDGDGQLEIVVGTGSGIAGTGGYKVYAWNGDGTPVENWPRLTEGNMLAPPALGDLDGDGDLEVVIGCGVGNGACQWLYAWHGDGSDVAGFPVKPLGFTRDGTLYHDAIYSPILADYDGDGVTEIMLSIMGAWGISIIEPDGTMSPDRTHLTHDNLLSAPLVDDVDNDGKLEVLVGGAAPDKYHGQVFIWDAVGTLDDALPWPAFHHDMWRSGNVGGVDNTPPTNPTLFAVGHTLSVWSSDDTVQVDWTGAADEDSGVGRYYYAWDTAPDTALDNSAAYVHADVTSLISDPLPGGTSHYFHLRTGDHAGNLATETVHLGPFWIDAQSPESVASSPPFAVGRFVVSWQGDDAGPSGVASYEIQARVGLDGAWTTWIEGSGLAQATYTDTVPGQTYFFRSVATDVAGNVELPDEDGDTSTTVTTYAFTGDVLNNREAPVWGAQVQAEPPGVGELSSDVDGAYGLFFDDAGDYQLTVQRRGFGALPSRAVSGGSVEGLDFYFPPADDLIRDGNWELPSGTLSGSAWEIQGALTVTLTEMAHTGDWALWMQGPGSGAVSQALTVSDSLAVGSVTLSWMALVPQGTVGAQDALTVEVNVEGAVQTRVISLADVLVGTWGHGYMDAEIDVQAGQRVTVEFQLDAGTGAALVLDEVSLGETAPGAGCVYLPLLVRH